jgi:hypothetical protein
MTEKIVKTNVVSIEYLDSHKCIRIEWLDYPESKEFRQGMDDMLEAMKKFNTVKILVPDGKLGAVREEDQLWVLENWTPRCLQLGKSRTAIVLSDDIFNQLSIESMVNQNTDIVADEDLKYFKSEEEAKNWL